MLDNQSIDVDYASEFHETGVIGPFRVVSEERAESFREVVFEEVMHEDASPAPGNSVKIFNRHIDREAIWKLCSHEEIVDRMSDIYGPDLMLWASRFWIKRPGAPRIPWHQHFYHMSLVPPVTLTAWIALTDCTVENGAVDILPNTHRKPVPQVESPSECWKGFSEMADPDEFEVNDPITMDIDAGEAFIFNERTLHQSPPNTTEDDVRIGLSARVTLPQVYLGKEYQKRGGSATMISGSDRNAINPLATPSFSSN